MVSPFFLSGWISSNIVEYNIQTRAESSVTMKSEHLNVSTSGEKSVEASLGSVLENDILLMVERFKSSNHATTLN